MKMTITTILSLIFLTTQAHADSTVFLNCSNLKNIDSSMGGSKQFSLAIVSDDDDVFIDLFDWGKIKNTQANVTPFDYEALWGVENKNDPSKDYYDYISLERLTGRVIYTYKLGNDKSVYSGFCKTVTQLF